MMRAILYYITIPWVYLVSWLPLWLLYRFSDALYVLMRIVKYRNKVILENLRYAFPEKTEKERTIIRNRFYRHFCDLIFETIKVVSISHSEIKRRVTLENLEILEQYYTQGRDVIAVVAHYGNWEWLTSFNLHLQAQGCEVYHPLKNPYMDRFMLRLRSRFKNFNFTMDSTLREVLKMKKANHRYVLGLIADQSPAKVKIQYRTVFLNQNTAVHVGPEKMATALNDAVVYFKMDKTQRGHYNVTILPVCESPKQTQPHEITESHVRILEQIIRQRPELWLWSHKRWKYSPYRTAIDPSSLAVQS
ncbi:lysophospholipid acyltransferase family protein [Breznakibacter xylanolyticus]|nr:lysophospholipid acyltransferase family protein [Breznakibacter xylanolyticus]